MINKRRKWLEAAKVLAKSPDENVTCPNCEKAYLTIRDEKLEEWDRIDRHLICPNCGATNIITLKDK